MARLYLHMNAWFDFETPLDGAAVPVVRDHLACLLAAHGKVREYSVLSVKPLRPGLIRLAVHLLLEGSAARQDTAALVEELLQLPVARREMTLSSGPVVISRLHRARVVA